MPEISKVKIKDSYFDIRDEYAADAIDSLEIRKQDNLISGVNLKTVNGQSLLGSGNIDVYTLDFYDGEYEVTPKVTEQILETKSKVMIKNVTVKEITKAVFDNEKGLTVQIGEI